MYIFDLHIKEIYLLLTATRAQTFYERSQEENKEDEDYDGII